MQNVTPGTLKNKEHFALLLRLQQSVGSHPLDDSMRLRALALVKDVLRSRLDADAAVNAQEWVHTAGFANLGKALAASRALQLAFEGFRSAAPIERTNISVILDSPGGAEADLAEPLMEHKDLLTAAKSGQVLITQAFYDKIAQYQPALRSSPLRAGVYEFLWTSEERLAELQTEAEWMPTLVPQEVVEPRALDVTAVYQSMQTGTRSRWKDPEAEPAPPEPQPVLEEAEEAPKRSLNPIVAITTALAMLLLIGFVVYTLVLSGNHAKTSAPPVAVPPQANVDQGPPPTPAPTTAPPQAKVDPGPPPVPKKPEPPPPAARPLRGCTIAGEEPDYLKLADIYRSRGDYERAITDYNLVLNCQPSNKLAQTGKRNAETAEKYASQ